MRIRISQEYEIEDGKVPSLLSSEVSIVHDGTTLLLEAIEWVEAIDPTMLMSRTNEYVAYKPNSRSTKYCAIFRPMGEFLRISFDRDTEVSFNTEPDPDFDYAKYIQVKEKPEMTVVLSQIFGVD